MGKMNCFAGSEDKSEGHEDQLTRAFLLVLRLVPDAHRAFLEQVSERRSADLPSLPGGSGFQPNQMLVRTQVGSIPGQCKRLLSVLLTDEPVEVKNPVGPKDRAPVYDGVITYGTDWVLIIENKPHHKAVWEDQLCPSILDAQLVESIESKAVVIAWQDMVRRMSAILDQPRLEYTARTIIRDFLDFVHENFPRLKPYDRLSVCGRHKTLLDERCRLIMEEIVDPERVRYHMGWKYYMAFPKSAAQQIALDAQTEATEERIVLWFCPGDTVNQARRFYACLNVGALVALAAEGWRVKANFHLAFMSDNLQPYPHVSAPLADYLSWWKGHQDMIMQLPVQGDSNEAALFKKFIRIWAKLGLISAPDVRVIQKQTLKTKRRTVNVCPGVNLNYSWPLATAAEMDDRGEFAGEVKRRLCQAIGTWGQEMA